MTTLPPPLSPDDLRKALLAAATREGGARIIWGEKILIKLADKHGTSDKDVVDIFRNWELLKSTVQDAQSWKYVIEGKNSIGDWMRVPVIVHTEPNIIAIPLSCYRCSKPKGN